MSPHFTGVGIGAIWSLDVNNSSPIFWRGGSGSSPQSRLRLPRWWQQNSEVDGVVRMKFVVAVNLVSRIKMKNIDETLGMFG